MALLTAEEVRKRVQETMLDLYSEPEVLADTLDDAVPDPLPSLPGVFKSFPNWVTWESLTVKGPRISGTRANASSSDPTTWVSYSTACANLAAGRGFMNLGFVTDGERAGYLTGIDMDACRNPETGELTEWAKSILAFLGDTYVDVTPSQSGIRAWVRASIPRNMTMLMSLDKVSTASGKKKAQQVEVFGDAKYFTMTGDVLNDADVRTLNDADVNELIALLVRLSVKKEAFLQSKTPRMRLAPQGDGTFKAEVVPPDEGFKMLFDAVGWTPLVKRMDAMADSRFHGLDIAPGEHSYCPMPGHAPRGVDIPYTPNIFGAFNAGEDELVHCHVCGFTGDLVSTVRAFDAGEDGGNIEYGTMYDCARAICQQEGLNFEEFFPEQNLSAVADVAEELQKAVQESSPTSQTAPEADVEEDTEDTVSTRRLTVADIRTQLNEAMQGRELPWSHGAAAEFFDVLFGENYLYSIYGKDGEWMTWNSHMWHKGNSAAMLKRMDALLKRVRTQIIPTLRVEDEPTYIALRALDKACSSATFMAGVMKMLQSKRLVEFEKFDPEGKHLVNFLNGTFELHTGTFRESRREDMLTQTMPVPFVRGATCDNWNQFLENSFPDADVREFLQRFFGYMLAGTGQEKYALFFHGYGDNGKTILMSVLMSLFGFKSEKSYGKAVGWDTFTENKSGTIRNDIARLHNSRAVFCDESEEGMVLKESMFKAVTGMSPITVRFLHKEYFTFMSRFVFLLATNRLPRVIGGDGATWRRILKVPMTESFPPGHEKRIENLEAVLMGEREGIVQWLVEGYRKYKQDGLKVPASILDASAEYRENSDIIEAFLAEVIQKAEGGRERFDVVYNRYASWCRGKNEKERARDSLIDILKSRGYQLRRHPTETGRPLYVYGMSLVPDQTGRVFGRSDMEALSNNVTFEVLAAPTGSVAWTGSDGQRHMD